MAVNACLWAVGLEDSIKADGDVGLVGPYQPSTFNFDGHVKGVKPSEMAGWDTPIPPKRDTISEPWRVCPRKPSGALSPAGSRDSRACDAAARRGRCFMIGRDRFAFCR